MEHRRFWFTFFFISGASTSIRIRHLDIPDAVRAGNEASLTCDYDLQKSRCDSRSVVLTDVHADMSGYYTCEVTTQKTFETVQARQYLLVVQPPSVGPEITGIPMEVRSGEWLKVQCHLPWMNVKPALEFFVNGKGVKHMNDIQVRKILKENVKGRKRMRPFEYSLVREGEDEVEFEGGGTTTVLEFPVKKHHVRQGKVEVRCKASAANELYESETVVRIPVVTSFSFFESSSAVATRWSVSVIIKICISTVLLIV